MIAFVLSWRSTFDCGLVKSTSTVGSPSIDCHLGLWRYGHFEMNNEGCWPYPDFLDIDSKWSAARVFNILALIGGFVCLVVDTLTIFDGERGKQQSIWIVNLLLPTCFFSGLTLLALDSSMCSNNELIEYVN